MALLSGILGAGACGGDDGSGTSGGTNDGCYDYGSFDGANPAVSFRTDVLPILQNSCGLSAGCHGSVSGPPTQPFLGPAPGVMPSDTEIMAIFTQNVNADAVKEPGMKRVAPEAPENSFIMHKIDGTFSCNLACAEDNTCGTRMPQGGTLTAAQADAIRRWIDQGAQNN